MAVATNFRTVIWLSLCLALGACGGGGGDGSSGDGGGPAAESPTDDPSTETPDNPDNPDDPDTPDTPETPVEGAPTVTVTSDIKQLQFSWDPQEGDEYYLFTQNPDGVVDLRIEDATQTTQDIAVHRHDWANAAYIVEACNASDECVPSVQVTTEDAMLSAIGYFKASNPGAGDEFGQSVALSDDGMTLAVGAHLEQSSSTGVNSEPNDELVNGPGAVYVFTLGESGWVQQAYIKAPAVAERDDFGHSVSLSADGRTLAVGATWGDSASPDGEVSIGMAHVFVRDEAGAWSWQTSLEATDAQPGSQFGTSVDLSGDGNLLAVGAPGGDSATGTDGEPTSVVIPGSVYLFSRTGVDWTQSANLVASNGEPGDEFGFDVALSDDGTTVAAGAYGEGSASAATPADNTAAQSGAIYVFSQGTEGWSQQAYLKASVIEANAHFGYSLALSDNGNLLAVSARDENLQAGAVDVFARTESTWSHQAHITASNGSGADSFGTDLALNGDGSLLAVSADWEDSTAAGVGGDQGSNTRPNSGAVYVFGNTGGTWTQTAYVKAPNPQDHSFFGHSIALDATGNTLAIGAIGENGASAGIGGDSANQFPEPVDDDPNTNVHAGAVYLY